MSIESCVTFFQELTTADKLKQQMKAVTDTKEIIALGRCHGYTFDVDELKVASASFSNEKATIRTSSAARSAISTGSAFYHYEFSMEQIPGFEQITRELNNLKIKPSTVDLNLYEQRFRAEDLQFTSISPVAPEFHERYQEVMQSHWQQPQAERTFSHRDFHLVNLDQHVEHPLYTEYFQAKSRIVSLLEGFFGSEIRFSGSMWYPPHSYRLWHTNETQPGWRMYLIDFDEPVGDSQGTSFFRYMNPQNKKIVTMEERPKLARFFKIEQEQDKLFWHCIVNATTQNRWSFGFAVPENWMDKLPHKS